MAEPFMVAMVGVTKWSAPWGPNTDWTSMDIGNFRTKGGPTGLPILLKANPFYDHFQIRYHSSSKKVEHFVKWSEMKEGITYQMSHWMGVIIQSPPQKHPLKKSAEHRDWSTALQQQTDGHKIKMASLCDFVGQYNPIPTQERDTLVQRHHTW